MAIFSVDALRVRLHAVAGNQQAIESLSHWIIFNSDAASEIVKTWLNEFYHVEPTRQLTLIYVANHVLQISTRKCGTRFVDLFATVLGKAMRITKMRGAGYGKKIDNVFRVLVQRKVFDQSQLKAIGRDLEGREESTGAASYENFDDGEDGKEDIADPEIEAKAAKSLVGTFQLLFSAKAALDSGEIERHLATHNFHILNEKVNDIESEINKTGEMPGEASAGAHAGGDGLFGETVDDEFELVEVEEDIVINIDEAMAIVDAHEASCVSELEERSKLLEIAATCLEEVQEKQEGLSGEKKAAEVRCRVLEKYQRGIEKASEKAQEEKAALDSQTQQREDQNKRQKTNNAAGWGAFSAASSAPPPGPYGMYGAGASHSVGPWAARGRGPGLSHRALPPGMPPPGMPPSSMPPPGMPPSGMPPGWRKEYYR